MTTLPPADETLVNIFLMLACLWRGGKYGYFWHKDGKWTEWVELGTPYLVPDGGDDVYWSVHPAAAIPPTNAQGQPVEPEMVRAQIPYVAAVNCLFAEFDRKDHGGSKDTTRQFITNRMPLPPSVIIDSGGGYHCYWLLSRSVALDDTTRPQMDALQKRFVALTGGDNGAKDLCRVLRVPGTTNAKYVHRPVVSIVDFNRTEYDLPDLVAIIDASAPVREPTNPIPATIEAKGYGAGRGLASFVAGRKKGERNNALLWAACRAFDKGMGIAEVEAELTPAALQAGLDEREILATIKSASNQPRRVAA